MFHSRSSTNFCQGFCIESLLQDIPAESLHSLLGLQSCALVPFPIINIVFREARVTLIDALTVCRFTASRTAGLRLVPMKNIGIAQHDCQGGVEVPNEKTIQEYFWETALVPPTGQALLQKVRALNYTAPQLATGITVPYSASSSIPPPIPTVV